MRAAEAKSAMANQAVNIQPKPFLVHQNTFTQPSINQPNHSIQTATAATILTSPLSQAVEPKVKQIPAMNQLARPTPTRPTISAFRNAHDNKPTVVPTNMSGVALAPTAVHVAGPTVQLTQKRRRELSSNDNEQSGESKFDLWTKRARKGGKVALQQRSSRYDFTNNSGEESVSSGQFSFNKPSISKSSFRSKSKKTSSAVTSDSQLLFALHQPSFDHRLDSKSHGLAYSDEEDMSSVTIDSSRDEEAALSPVSLSR